MTLSRSIVQMFCKMFSTPAENITQESTAENFYNTFDKKDQNATTEVLFKKVTNKTSEMQNGEEEKVDQGAKKIKGHSIYSWR